MFYYNDISVLNLKTLSWFSVSMHGGIKEPRSMHVSFVYRKKLIIFGGINETGYLNNQIGVIEFDQKRANEMILYDKTGKELYIDEYEEEKKV